MDHYFHSQVLLVTAGRVRYHRKTTSTEIYSASTGAWTFVGNLPFVLSLSTANVINYNNILYLFGGQGNYIESENNFLYHDEILKFDDTTEKWTQVGRMTKARFGNSVSYVEGEIMQYCYDV